MSEQLEDPALRRARRHRAEYAKLLRQCEEGTFRLGSACLGGELKGTTEEQKAHLRQIIASLDALIASWSA